MKAHQAMDADDRFECRFDRAADSLPIFSARGDFDERAKQGTATAEFNV
jgi:hypothetical protein